MRIGFDARMIAWKGVGTYSRNLLRHFSDVPDLEVVCFYNDESRDQIPDSDNFSLVALDEEIISSRGLNKIGQIVNKAGCDLFHTPYIVAPSNLQCPLLVTVHDVIPLLFPKSLPNFRIRRAYKSLLADAVRKADHIITVSTVSQSYLLANFSMPLSRISVILDGVSGEFGPRGQPECDAVSREYGLKQPFILWLGEFLAHKNVEKLVGAYASLSARLRSGYLLVLAGDKGDGWEAARKEAENRKVEGRVLFPGYISDPDLPALYSAADLFCFPSLYEGFGLPPLEAMACGTPVVCSNTSSLPEVVGDGGLLVAPRSSSLAAAITEVLTNDNLKQRLSRRGRERAALFSWEKAVAKTLDMYRELVAG